MKAELKRDELIKYLSLVALHLGGWRLDIRCQYHVYLCRNDGLRLFVRNANHTQGENGKLFFSGVLPKGYAGSRTTPTIGVSFDRPAQSVARDIENRLVKCFEIELIEIKKKIKAQIKKKERLDIYKGLLENIGFDDFREAYNSRGYRREFYSKHNQIEMTTFITETCSDVKINGLIKINGLDMDQLIKLSYFIKTL